MSLELDYSFVSDSDRFDDLVETLSESNLVGFDTEFVAEDCYQPDLCLLQFSTRDKIFILDPRAFEDLSAVWNLLVDGERTVIVHAGREEIIFVRRATGKSIPKLFDVQVAVGLLGGEYPASYGKLLQRFMDVSVPKAETRTDWRKRPLTNAQLDYAALDVWHLPELYDLLCSQLDARGRLGWMANEIESRQLALVDYLAQEGWARISGVQSLRGKQLAIVRELWRWREQRAEAKNMPARRVLRDDLIIELAKRGSSDTRKMSQIRGLHHSGFQRFLPELAECVRTGAKQDPPPVPWLKNPKRSRPPALLQQFLTAAMSYLCRSSEIAPGIVGTSDDVGKLAGYWLAGRQLQEGEDEFPNLLRGWRREFVGDPLHDIFLGKNALRVENPRDEMPLSLCRLNADGQPSDNVEEDG